MLRSLLPASTGRRYALVGCLLMSGSLTTPAMGWGATGHTFLTRSALEALAASPDGVPAFLSAPAAVQTAGELSRELDRSRGAGRLHDEERDPGHYINLDEDGTVLGVFPLSNLARTREDFDTMLRARGASQYKTGYLPYALTDGWQQLVKDFAYWRTLTAVIDAPDTPADRKAWATSDRAYREQVTLRDLGVWSHYVGDASQPLHVTRHHDGWGAYPNPAGWSEETGTHWRIEGPFVRRTVTQPALSAAMRPYKECRGPIEVRLMRYLQDTRSFVTELYDLDKQGAFDLGKPGEQPPPAPNPRGIKFVTERLAAGASELRDLVIDAWKSSLDAKVGYPEVSVRAVLKTPSILTPDVFGVD